MFVMENWASQYGGHAAIVERDRDKREKRMRKSFADGGRQSVSLRWFASFRAI